jgi:hypothetical protein
MNLGLNVLYDAFPNRDFETDIIKYLNETPQKSILITSGSRAEQALSFARDLKRLFPTLDVIYRRFPDDHQHERMSASQWLSSYLPFSDGGITLYDMNESGTGDIPNQVNWLGEILEQTGRRGVSVCSVNLQTHNLPNPEDWYPFKDVLSLFGKYRQHKLGLHYYYDKENGFPVEFVHKAVIAACSRLNISKPAQFYITELGYAKRLDPYKGYLTGISETSYLSQLIDIADDDLSVIYFIYGYGGYNQWTTFDISGSKIIMNGIKSYNQSRESVEPLFGIGLRQTIPTLGYTVRVRATPSLSGTVLGALKSGDQVVVYPCSETLLGENQWVYVVKGSLEGWSDFKYLGLGV